MIKNQKGEVAGVDIKLWLLIVIIMIVAYILYNVFSISFEIAIIFSGFACFSIVCSLLLILIYKEKNDNKKEKLK